MVSYRPKGEIPSSLDLLPLGERFGDKNKARQRARPSAKFQHIKSSIDHGQIKKRLSQLEVKDQNVLTRRKGENFGRIAPQTLAYYISEGRASEQLSRELDDIQVLRWGHYPTRRPPAETEGPKIVLLDLRSAEEYCVGHISKALSFPAANIQKDQTFAKLSIYKNKPDKILVLYHEDERHGTLQARIIFEKGFDNVYLLSGGLCIFAAEFPDLIETRANAEVMVSAGVAPVVSAQAPSYIPSQNSMGAMQSHYGAAVRIETAQSQRFYR